MAKKKDLPSAMERALPVNIEAEEALLGALILSRDAWDKTNGIVKEGDFYPHKHRVLFRGIAELHEGDTPIDPVTLDEWFKSRGQLEEIGGAEFLFHLYQNTPSAANAVAYAKIVAEKSLYRRAVDAGVRISEAGYQGDSLGAERLLQDCEAEVYGLRRGDSASNQPEPLKHSMREYFRDLTWRHENPGKTRGLRTGIKTVDALIPGMEPGDLFYLAGRPGMGKTSAAATILLHNVLVEKKVGLFFSLEMSKSQITERLMAMIGKVNLTRLRQAHLLDDTDWGNLSRAVETLATAEGRMLLDDQGGMTVSDVRSKARRVAAEHGLDLIVIDYVQLMGSANKDENRNVALQEISKGLKEMAKELKVPVIALSQLNRSVELRQEKRPVMSDLRESGGLEQDADAVVFVYRHEYYHPEDETSKGKGEWIIGKQRNGPTGTAHVSWEGQYTLYGNLRDDAYRGYLE